MSIQKDISLIDLNWLEDRKWTTGIIPLNSRELNIHTNLSFCSIFESKLREDELLSIIREPGVLYTYIWCLQDWFFPELVLVGSIHSRYRPFSKKSASIQLERQSSISGLWTFHGIFFQAYFCFSCAKKADKTNCIYYLSTLKNNFFSLPFILSIKYKCKN